MPEPPYPPYSDRQAAGEKLARAVQKLDLQLPLLVLGLPRGGVPVAYEVARALQAPLDVMVVRKIGLPWQPEFAIGAIASGNILIKEVPAIPRSIMRGIAFDALVRREQRELERREHAYRGDAAPPMDMKGKTVVLVDDGLATGATMLAAIRAARQAGAASVVAAAPVASRDAAAAIKREADQTVFPLIPSDLLAIGEWYVRFDQVEDSEVLDLLRRARR